MKFISKLSIILASAVVLTTATAYAETTFPDVADTNPAKDEIIKMYDAGIIEGHPDGTFKPDDYIKRSEFIKIINKTLKLDKAEAEITFTDVTKDSWYYGELSLAVTKGYINGYPDNTFKPDGNITRQEFCKVLDCLFDITQLPFDRDITDQVDDWAKPYVNKVVSARIMLLEENDTFRAVQPITRAEVCKVMANYIVADTLPTLPEEETTGGGTGGSGSTGGSDSSGGSSGSSDDDDTTNEPTKEQIDSALNSVSQSLKDDIIPSLSSDEQKSICNKIYDNIQSYMNDNSYDYETVANNIRKNDWSKLSQSERDELKNAIGSNISIQKLDLLADFFFPGEDY